MPGTVAIDPGALDALGRALDESARLVELWQSRAAAACTVAGRVVPPAVEALLRTAAVLAVQALDAQVRAAEAERSQRVDLGIRKDFADNGFTPDAWFDGLDTEGKVDYWMRAQLAGAGWALPIAWDEMGIDAKLAWWHDHAVDVRCSSARNQLVCENEEELLVVPEWMLTISLSVAVPEATTMVGEALTVASSLPFGFASRAELALFNQRLFEGLAEAGFAETDAAVAGSAATGRSFTSGIPFDVGRLSDLDIAIAGDDLFGEARLVDNISLRSAQTRTGPLDASHLDALGLGDLQAELTTLMRGRDVNFMAYKNIEGVLERGRSILLR